MARDTTMPYIQLRRERYFDDVFRCYVVFCYFLGFSAISFGQYKLIQIADKYDKSI